MSNTIKESYEKIQMAQESKDKIYENIVQSQGTSEKKVISFRKYMKVAVIVACLFVGSGTLYAASRWLSAPEALEQMGEKTLAEKFAKKDAEVLVQTDGKYRGIYLGEVSGKLLLENDVKASEEKTYFVVAVKRTDKKKISLEEKIIISPFVKGYAPWAFNIYSMSGNEETQIIDGVLYHMVESENMEMFADKGVYLGIMDGAPSQEKYSFDEKSGEIKSVKDYEGMNMLFELPMDKTKANPEKAEECLRNAGVLEEEKTFSDGEQSFEEKYENKTMFFTTEEIETVLADCVVVEESRKESEEVKQKNGTFYSYEWKDYHGVVSEKMLQTYSEDGKMARVAINFEAEKTEGVILFENVDGKVMGTFYRWKE